MARTITGTVSSDKGDKTIVVTIKERKTHPIYKKQYSVTKKFMAHDEKNTAQVGDLVVIAETRPISARKRFMLETIVERAGVKFLDTDNQEAEIKAKKAAAEAAKAEADAATDKEGDA